MVEPLLTLLGFLGLGLVLSVSLDPFVQFNIQMVLVNCILAMSLNLVNGFTGQFSLGHAGFMAVGAYVSGFLSMQFPMEGWMQLPYFTICTLAGASVAALAGWLVGQPSLRLKGDYLAIVTLGFSEIIRITLINMDVVGGARGLSGIPGFSEMPELVMDRFVYSFVYISCWLILTFFTLWRLIYSSHGRSFLAVREDEIAAESMGVNTTGVKVRAFVLSAFFAGVAGSLFALVVNYLSPTTFNIIKSFDVVIMVVLGGMGSLSGSLIGAIIVTVLPEALRPIQNITGVDIRLVIYSLALILIMIIRPEGIFGTLELPEYWRKYARFGRK